METITGLPATFIASTSRRICSEAKTEPPGELTLNTTALTVASWRACLNRALVETPPMIPASCSPFNMVPSATTIAILEGLVVVDSL